MEMKIIGDYINDTNPNRARVAREETRERSVIFTKFLVTGDLESPRK
jgi:hypothetical protein